MTAPRLVAAGLWLVATILSTAIVWTATSNVAADVTDRPAPVIEHHDVVRQLESGSPEPQPTTTAVASGAGPLTTTPSDGERPAPATASPPSTAAPTESPEPPVSASPSSPPRSGAPVSPPTTRPGPEATVRPTATFSTPGGSVRVACEGFFFISLISATPADGYRAVVVDRGPGKVEVDFVRAGQDFSVNAFCFGQPIRYSEETGEPRPRGS